MAQRLRETPRHKLIFGALAFFVTLTIMVVFALDARTNMATRDPTIIYVENWRADRSMAEVQADRAQAKAEGDAARADLAKRQAAYKESLRNMGLLDERR